MGKLQRGYDHAEAELLFSDYAARAGLRAAAPPVGAFDGLVRELAALTARVGVLITEENEGPTAGIYVVSVMRKGVRSSEATIELNNGGIRISKSERLKVDLFWNPFAHHFEGRELDADGKRTDALTVLARAVVEAIEKD